jgi:hypothetical protein
MKKKKIIELKIEKYFRFYLLNLYSVLNFALLFMCLFKVANLAIGGYLAYLVKSHK